MRNWINLHEVELLIVSVTGISVELMKETTREADVIFARHLLFWFLYYHKIGGKYWSLAKIGRYRREPMNHASVIHAAMHINNMIWSDKITKAIATELLLSLELSTKIIDKIASGKTKKLKREYFKIK